MGRWLIITLAALVFLFVPARAQEQGASPERKPLLENARLRVFEIRFKPGARTDALSQSNRFVYALTDGSLVFAPPGKTPYELSFSAGEALWLPAETTATLNDTDKEVRALVVELKEATASPAVAAKKTKRGKVKGAKRSSGSARGASKKRAKPAS